MITGKEMYKADSRKLVIVRVLLKEIIQTVTNLARKHTNHLRILVKYKFVLFSIISADD